jgi:hypothetical protein
VEFSHPEQGGVFRSWDEYPEDRALLIVTMNRQGVQVIHSANASRKAEMTVFSLSHKEAALLADDIKRVLEGRQGNGYAEDARQCLKATYTNEGEPFREGVELSIDTGNWMRDFSFRMDKYTATAICEALLNPDFIVEPEPVEEQRLLSVGDIMSSYEH